MVMEINKFHADAWWFAGATKCTLSFILNAINLFVPTLARFIDKVKARRYGEENYSI